MAGATSHLEAEYQTFEFCDSFSMVPSRVMKPGAAGRRPAELAPYRRLAFPAKAPALQYNPSDDLLSFKGKRRKACGGRHRRTRNDRYLFFMQFADWPPGCSNGCHEERT